MNGTHPRSAIPWWRHLFKPTSAALAFIAWYLWHAPAQWQYDSRELYHGCREILDWLQGRTPTIAHPRPFPLFQYPSALVAHWAMDHHLAVNIYPFWCACSLVGFAGIIFLFRRTAQRLHRPAIGWWSAATMLGGPLLMYANSTFNEMVAAFLILWFTAAVLTMGRPLICVLLFWASGITKETAPLLLLVIWLGALWMNRSRLERRRLVNQIIALLCAAFLAMATNAGFNLLRYGTLLNREYLLPPLLVHSLSWRLQYCVALWISPNGGVVWFWPTLTITLISVTAVALRQRQRTSPAILVLIELGLLTVGLSGWYQPFGWWSWGPRLLFPWLPACLLILLHGYPEAFSLLVNRCTRRKAPFIITSSLICVFTLPHIMAANAPWMAVRFFLGDAQFPYEGSPWQPVEEHAVLAYLAWRKMPPMLVRPILDGTDLLQAFLIACFLSALLVLLRECRRTSRLI